MRVGRSLHAGPGRKVGTSGHKWAHVGTRGHKWAHVSTRQAQGAGWSPPPERIALLTRERRRLRVDLRAARRRLRRLHRGVQKLVGLVEHEH